MHLSIIPNNVVNRQIFPAQRQDCKTIEQLWQDWPWGKIYFVVADKGYDIEILLNLALFQDLCKF